MERYIGIDVSKNSLEIAESGSNGSTSVPNTPKGDIGSDQTIAVASQRQGPARDHGANEHIITCIWS